MLVWSIILDNFWKILVRLMVFYGYLVRNEFFFFWLEEYL